MNFPRMISCSSIEGFIINNNENVEYITDRKNIGDLVSIKVIGISGERKLNIKLNKFYDDFYIISTSLTAILFLIIALFVLIKKAKAKQRISFIGQVLERSLIMCTTWANQNTYPQVLNYLLRGIFHFAYVFNTSTIYSLCILFS